MIADSCGVRLRWDVLDGRSTTWQICVGPGGWTQKLRDERHTFFGIGDQTTEQALLQRLADRWTAQLRAHAEHWAAVYPMTWGAP